MSIPKDVIWFPSESDANAILHIFNTTGDKAGFMLLKSHAATEKYLRNLLVLITTRQRITLTVIDPNTRRPAKVRAEEMALERQSYAEMVDHIIQLNVPPQDFFNCLKNLNAIRNKYAHDFKFRLQHGHIDYIIKPWRYKFDELFINYSTKHQRNLALYTEHVLTFLLTSLIMFSAMYSRANSLVKLKRIEELILNNKIRIGDNSKLIRIN